MKVKRSVLYCTTTPILCVCTCLEILGPIASLDWWRFGRSDRWEVSMLLKSAVGLQHVCRAHQYLRPGKFGDLRSVLSVLCDRTDCKEHHLTKGDLGTNLWLILWLTVDQLCDSLCDSFYSLTLILWLTLWRAVWFILWLALCQFWLTLRLTCSRMQRVRYWEQGNGWAIGCLPLAQPHCPFFDKDLWVQHSHPMRRSTTH